MKSNIFKIYSGDVNGFFGLFLNNITNLIALSGILLGIGMSKSIVFGRIIPASAFACFIGAICYFIMANKLAKRTGRDDVTSLPIGISVPHMFIITFVIILPVLTKTNDPIKAWQAAVAWSFIEGLVEISGAYMGNYLRSKIPRAAMLGTLAGVSLAFISIRSVVASFEKPYLSFLPFGILFLGWFNNKGYIKKIPVGFLIIIVAIFIGVVTKSINFENLKTVSFSLNLPKIYILDLISGLKDSWSFIITALPFGIYNFFETMDNLESAAVSGDDYNTRKVMFIDGVSTIIGTVLGSGFPTAVYIGHAGWKKIGSRKMYVLMSSSTVLLLSITGTIIFLYNVIPLEAIFPILVYIGIIITEQAFSASPKEHYPAIVLAILPQIASWAYGLINTSIIAGGGSLTASIDTLYKEGVPYMGFQVYGSGAIVVGMLWSSLLIFIIDDKIKNAVLVSLLSALFSYIGIIHSTKISLGSNINITIAYLMLTVLFIIILFIKKRNTYKSIPVTMNEKTDDNNYQI